jgi:hypothetical protein
MCITYVVMYMVMEISALHALHLTLDHATPLGTLISCEVPFFRDPLRSPAA